MFDPAENYIEKATNAGLAARRYLDESHFQAYLKGMKDSAEKVSHYLPPFPNALLSRNWINGWGLSSLGNGSFIINFIPLSIRSDIILFSFGAIL